jgi:hypothetical protein
MKRKAGWIAAGVTTLVVLGGAGAIAMASSGDSDTPITGAAYDRATKSALAATEPGKVTETESGDEESYYQVEITHPDGSVTDVNLDESFTVVKVKNEGPEPADDPAD